ncbi:MAG: membrane fusion protein (multidrug efflux system) [Verrucomicrobiales bacterium]|jgi:membrane fusion protein (multidrug efflux system)
MKSIHLLIHSITLLLLVGCGKPPAQQGPGGGGAYPASAVVALVTEQTVEDKVDLVASLAANEMVSVVSELDAKLLKIHFTEGQRVKQGDVLFTFDQVVTQAKLKEAESAYAMAAKTFDRGKQLLANQTISQQEFDQAETQLHQYEATISLARDEQQKTAITAPFDGIIGEKKVSAGQFVSRNQSLAQLIQVDPLQVVFEVPERYIGRLGETRHVSFTSEAYPGERFTGKIIYSAPLVDEKSRTLRTKAELSNTDGRLKPGMFGELALVFSERKHAMIIPEACIQLMGGTPTVVTVSPQGISGFAPVKTGARFKGKTEILEGLTIGDMIVIEGFQKMGPGMQVIASPESAQYDVTPGPLFQAAPAVPPTAAVTNAEENVKGSAE